MPIVRKFLSCKWTSQNTHEYFLSNVNFNNVKIHSWQNSYVITVQIVYLRMHKDFFPKCCTTSCLQAEHINLMLSLLAHSASTLHVLKVIGLESSSVGRKAAWLGEHWAISYTSISFSWHFERTEVSWRISLKSIRSYLRKILLDQHRWTHSSILKLISIQMQETCEEKSISEIRIFYTEWSNEKTSILGHKKYLSPFILLV